MTKSILLTSRWGNAAAFVRTLQTAVLLSTHQIKPYPDGSWNGRKSRFRQKPSGRFLLGCIRKHSSSAKFSFPLYLFSLLDLRRTFDLCKSGSSRAFISRDFKIACSQANEMKINAKSDRVATFIFMHINITFIFETRYFGSERKSSDVAREKNHRNAWIGFLRELNYDSIWEWNPSIPFLLLEGFWCFRDRAWEHASIGTIQLWIPILNKSLIAE